MDKFTTTVIDLQGRAVQGATVAIYETGTSTLAALFEDDETTAKSNPLTSNEYGLVQARIANGQYDFQVTVNGTAGPRINGVELYDPDDDTGSVADNSVTTAKIVDEAVTLPKIDGGTANVLLGRDASGNTAEITAGSRISIAAGVINTAAALGKVLQVQMAEKTDTFTSTSESWTDVTGLSVSITPSSNSSKVLVIANVAGAQANGGGQGFLRLVRGSTAIGVGASAGSRKQAGVTLMRSAGETMMTHTMIVLDSPSTTSSTTYKVQCYEEDSTLYINRSPSDNDDEYRARGHSTIIVAEIGP